MSLSFVFWAMANFNERRFALCGKTINSLRRNLLSPIMPLLSELGFEIQENISRNMLYISCFGNKNEFYIFGGKDESSAALIQGITLAGVLFDEVALQPRSFVHQACARCSVDGSKFWFNCNPEGPGHWFYNEWIKNLSEKNALYFHYTMEDFPALSVEVRKRYESLYSGVFYRRFILGRWVAAEGQIYDFFDESYIEYSPPKDFEEYYISCDYGTLNPFSAGLWCWDGKKATRMREFYYSGREKRENKTDEEYYDEVDKLAGDLPIKGIVVDPSAASFIEVVRRRKKYHIRKAVNDVIPGIATVARYLQDGTIKIHRSCKDCIREFGLYRWDEDKTEDKPIKENDHAMDEVRYFTMTILRHKVGKTPYIPIYNGR